MARDGQIGRGEGRTGTVVVVLITLAAVAWPLGSVLWTVIAGVMAGDINAPAASAIEPALSMKPAWRLLASTLAWGMGIATGATILAWPAAWVIRRRGWGALPLLMVPLLLPSYLAYSGYSTLRAPGTPLGDWIEHLVQLGHTDAPSIAGNTLAAMGLVLWAWPIATVVLGATLRRLDESVLETLRMDAPKVRRWVQVLSLSKFGIMGAIGAVTLIMIGSAVPLHLAQVPTYAIKVWLDLTLTVGSWRVWLASWPLITIAIVAGWVLASRIVRESLSPDESLPARRKGGGGAWLCTGGVWALSVIVPLMLFVRTVNDPKSYGQFWIISGDAVLNSSLVAGGVAVVGIALAAGFWQGLSSIRRGGNPWLLTLCLRALLVMGLLPGVLVGTAITTACNLTPGTDSFSESLGVLVLAHVARFGFVAALIGCWLAAIEPRQERELRAVDAALGVRGWIEACLPIQGGALVGGGLAMGALSLHEIEAAVIVQPPGSPGLAKVMLDHLHYLRMQDVSSAAVMVVLLGLAVAAVTGWALSRTLRQIS